jgi:hypothetical protein
MLKTDTKRRCAKCIWRIPIPNIHTGRKVRNVNVDVLRVRTAMILSLVVATTPTCNMMILTPTATTPTATSRPAPQHACIILIVDQYDATSSVAITIDFLSSYYYDSQPTGVNYYYATNIFSLLSLCYSPIDQASTGVITDEYCTPPPAHKQEQGEGVMVVGALLWRFKNPHT